MARRKLSRRILVSAVAGAMPLAEAVAASPPLVASVRHVSSEWLALKQREHALSARWSAVEAWLMEHFDWASLTEDEQLELPEAQELRDLDWQLEQLEQQRRECRARLLSLPAKALEDTLRKFRIIADSINPVDHSTIHELLTLAIDEMETLLVRRALH